MAQLFRRLPFFKGKGRLSRFFHSLLSDDNHQENIVTVQMRSGFSMRIDLRSSVENLSFWLGEYDGKVIQKLTKYLKTGGTVLDAGANIGFYSVPLGLEVKKRGGLVYAFEPVESNYNRLKENIALNHLIGVVIPFRLALGNSEGFADLSLESWNHPETGNAAISTISARAGSSASVRISKLDTIAIEKDIRSCHLIKVDIEGFELDFLKGGEAFIRRHRPLIYCELNYWRMEDRGWYFEDLLNWLRPLKYEPFRDTGNRFVLAARKGTTTEDLLLVPQEPF